MATGNEEARFSVHVDSNAAQAGDDGARGLANLRDRIQEGEQALRDMNGGLRRLKGSSDEVKKAKEELSAKIRAEREAISAAQLALVKAGTSYDALTQRTKKLVQEKKELTEKRMVAMNAAMKNASGPVAALRDRLEQLRSIAGGAGGSIGVLTLAVAGTVAVLAALVVGAGAAVVALSKFVIEGANAARSAQLLRESAAGSAENAANLGTQVDALAQKLPTAKAALNELAASLAKQRLSGQTVVDTLNAVGQASAALGDEAGNKVKELVTRSQLWQRMAISPFELVGTGIEFDDIAASLASSMKVGLNEARVALWQGRVRLEDGAKALRLAMDKRFGEVNARKMLDINVQAQKLRERLGNLTAGVKLEPLLRALDKMASAFDESTVTGATLKELVTVVGNGLVGAFEKVAPLGKAFLQGLIIGALQVGIAFLRLRRQLRETFGDEEVLKGINLTKLALESGRYVVTSFAVAVGLTMAAIASMGVVLRSITEPFAELYEAIIGAKNAFKEGDWIGLGKSVVDGLLTGLSFGTRPIANGVATLAHTVKGGFKKALGIASPSKVFAEYGQFSAEGFSEGVDRGGPGASRALERMATPSTQSPGGARGGVPGRSAAPITVNVTIHAGGGSSDTAKALSEPSFMQSLVKAIQDALVGAGIAVPS